MKRHVARKFYYYLIDGKIFKNSVDVSCLQNAKLEDIYKKHESHLEKITFYSIDDDGKETAKITYYFGIVHDLNSLKLNEREEYDKIKANRRWEQDAENDDVFVRTESGRFITVLEPNKAKDVSRYIHLPSNEDGITQ